MSSYRNLYYLVFILLVVLAGILTSLWQHSKLNNANYQNSQLSIKLSGLTSQNKLLTKQVGQLSLTVNALTRTNNFSPGAPCQTQQLALSQEGTGHPAAGNRYMLWSYKNTSDTTCTVDGYPGFLALDSSGYVMPDGPVKTEESTALLTLNPNDKAYFFLHWGADGETPTEKCITTSLIESTPPGNTYPLITPASFELCDAYIGVSALGTLSQYNIYL